MKQDYYETLGLGKNATPEEIKSAYRRAALKYHPDKNPGDKSAEDKFKEINEAYEILSDPNKKTQYDRFGHAGVGNAPPPPPGQGGYGGFEYQDFGNVGDMFGDIFGDIFGGAGGARTGRRQRTTRGADLRYDLELSLLDAFRGTEIPLEIPRMATCPTCSGSGAKPGTAPKECPQCKGSGQVRYSQGFFSFSQTCPRCKGAGEVVEDPCPTCRGSGRVRETHRITVRIPPGVDEGTSLRVSGAGEAGERGAPPGDLYVVIQLKPDPRFTRREDDLLTNLALSFTKVVFGGEFDVPTLEGTVKVRIPAGTQPDTVFRVKGGGFTRLGRKGRGDLLVHTTVAVPKNPNDRQKQALRQFAEASGEHEDSPGFFKKVFG